MVTPRDHLVQAELRTQTGIPADNIVNTFAFTWDGAAGSEDYQALCDILDDFYEDLQASVLSNLLSSTAAAHEFKVYRLTDAQPRPPVYTQQFSISAGANSFPAEVAICASFQSIREAGQRQSRRRGRIFLGPLRSATASPGSDGYPRITENTRNIIATACEDLAIASASADWAWCVWSRADNLLHAVTNGWVEDEFDTQRRRGPGPLTRTTWGSLGP